MPHLTDNGLGCSFCGKAHDKVKKLIAGPALPAAYICNECVESCLEALDDFAPHRLRSERISRSLLRRNEPGSDELQRLIDKAAKALAGLRRYFAAQLNGSPSADDRGRADKETDLEFVLGFTLFLEAKKRGSCAPELLPLIDELVAFHVQRNELEPAAELLEWALVVLESRDNGDRVKRA